MPTEKRLEKMKTVVAQRQNGLVVVLEDIHDPHNAEAIFRSCETFGVQEIYLIFGKEKPFNPRRVGKASSSSANKWLDFNIYHSTKECLGHLKKNGFKVIATALDRKARDLFEADSLGGKKIALLLGNEREGLSEEALRFADEKIFIPMRGFVQSLNVSVTAGICLFEITRQRSANGNAKALPKKDQAALLKKFTAR